MNELLIIREMINKASYSEYSALLNKEYLRFNQPELYKVLQVLDVAHNTHISLGNIDGLEAVFFSEYPALNKAEKETCQALFKRMREVELPKDTLDVLIKRHRERSFATAIGGIAQDVAEGRKDFSALSEAVMEFGPQIVPEKIEDRFVDGNLKELLDTTYRVPGLRWRLKTLRAMMGSLRKGDMGFLFARPEVGKTTFLASEISNFAQQVENPIIHFNNEEYGPKVKLRYYQAVLGLTTEGLNNDWEGNERKYQAITQGKIKIFDQATITKSMVEAVCKEYNPSVLVFDSIDKIRGFEEDRDDLVYKKIYAWARELAKTYGPVIGVCHASVSGENKKWLTMDDVAYAKTAKQGEADWILGIGQIYEDQWTRFLHLSKNKLMGDEDFKEEFRHGRLPVMIHPETAQFSDLVKID